MEDFTGGPRQSLPCSAGDTSLIPDSGGPHISWSNYIHVPQLLSPHTATVGSGVVAHRPSCLVACGICWDQGSNLCPLHCKADS